MNTELDTHALLLISSLIIIIAYNFTNSEKIHTINLIVDNKDIPIESKTLPDAINLKQLPDNNPIQTETVKVFISEEDRKFVNDRINDAFNEDNGNENNFQNMLENLLQALQKLLGLSREDFSDMATLGVFERIRSTVQRIRRNWNSRIEEENPALGFLYDRVNTLYTTYERMYLSLDQGYWANMLNAHNALLLFGSISLIASTYYLINHTNNLTNRYENLIQSNVRNFGLFLFNSFLSPMRLNYLLARDHVFRILYTQLYIYRTYLRNNAFMEWWRKE